MIDVATHVRIFEADPSDDFVTKRIAAVKALATKFGKENDVETLLGFANGIAAASSNAGQLPDALADVIEKAIRHESTAFVKAGHEVQLAAVGLMALGQAIAAAKPASTLSIIDVLANGAWLGLGWQVASPNARLEALRAAVLQAARKHSLASAAAARVRAGVPDMKTGAVAEDLSDAVEKTDEAANRSIAALRQNAILDREELDFLWWALSDYSDLNDAQFSALSPPVAAVAAALEGAQMLRRLPAEAHKHVLLRHVRAHEPLTLAELLAALGEARAAMSGLTYAGRAAKFPRIFGALAAVSTGVVSSDPGKTSLGEWAARLLAEAGFMRVWELLPGGKV